MSGAVMSDLGEWVYVCMAQGVGTYRMHTVARVL